VGSSGAGVRRWGPGVVALGGLAAAVGAWGTGCGPSYQAVYECEVHFEHCNALDYDPRRVDAQKDCWRVYLKEFTYGQPRDHVEWAAARYSELSLDQTLPSEDTAVRPHRKADVTAPLPTSAFAPPPNLAGDGVVAAAAAQAVQPVTAGATGPRPPATGSMAPGEQCTDACAQRWTACRKGCTDGACTACDGAYKACVPGCFTDVRQAPRSLK
jgi:hypothetical protein